MADKNLYKRLARAEAAANAQRAEQMETLRAAYQAACDVGNEPGAAELARKLRNKLLEQSDAVMSIDRLGLTMPEGTSFTAWLGFLRGFAQALTSPWARYRQQLRDLPQQEGFPFRVEFPKPPEEGESE